MSHDDKDPEEKAEFERRRFLQWTSTIGLGSVFGSTFSDIAEARATRVESSAERIRKEGKPEPVPEERRGSPFSDRHFRHKTELPAVQKGITQYDRSGEPSDLYSPRIREAVEGDISEDEVVVQVYTMGESSSVTTKKYSRELNGWTPKDEEIEALREYGKLEFASDFTSTQVVLSGVKPSDVPEIADKDFVVYVDRFMSEGEGEPEPEASDDGVWHKNELYSTSFYWYEDFESDYSIDNIQVAVIDNGYDYASHGSFDTAWAEDEVGIDEGTADAFNSDWDNAGSHGTDVADALAYQMREYVSGSHDPIVPLRAGHGVCPDKGAIEFAMQNDIEVINHSRDIDGPSETCPDDFCDEYSCYVDCGYIPLAAAGNIEVIPPDDRDNVANPAISWFTIGVGGFHTEQSQGYARHLRSRTLEDSTVSDIYHNCSNCSQDAEPPQNFEPMIYGAYLTETDSGSVIDGTSFATPAAAVSAVMMQDNGLFDYSEARGIFSDMQYLSIIPDEAADEGQIIDAFEAHWQTI